ncbi:MAG: hypothetical protein K1X94_02855 [Sandaracinaceae bacterium]|nr:hypothetical protein [Sandaracinaceae bacterium]
MLEPRRDPSLAERALLSFAAALVVCATGGLALPAHAQVPFAAGTYERWSSLFEAPSGPLPSSGSPLLPEWITVEVHASTAHVTFEPERRVEWRIRYGPSGAIDKRVFVDRAEVLHARYERDAQGHVVRKTASGALAPGGLLYTYQTDAQGRVVVRERAIDASTIERLEVRWTATDVVAVLRIGGHERRRDRWDAAGRLLSSTFVGLQAIGGGPPQQHELHYRRDGAGALVAVERARLGQGPSTATFAQRDASVHARDLDVLAASAVERSEARLLLGLPATIADRGRGAARELTDSFSDGCWLNETSLLAYDATGLYTQGQEGCICGLCVEASQPWHADRIEGLELHVRRGGWLRIDGELVITGDHELVTPTGPRRADALLPGDLVMDPDGRPFAIRTIEALADEPRLGRNVETAEGSFAVGRFVVVSEPYAGPQTSCPPR